MGKCGGDDVSSIQGPGLVVKEPQSGASLRPFQGTHKVKTVTLRWCLSFHYADTHGAKTKVRPSAGDFAQSNIVALMYQ